MRHAQVHVLPPPSLAQIQYHVWLTTAASSTSSCEEARALLVKCSMCGEHCEARGNKGALSGAESQDGKQETRRQTAAKQAQQLQTITI